MSAIQRTLTTVRARLFYQECLRNLGWAALAALIVAAALLVTGRLLGTSLSVWLYAVALVVAVASALVSAGLRFPSTTHAATAVDQRLGLKDRLATSLYVRKLPSDPFAALVLEDAEQAAGNLALRPAFPIRLTRVWRFVLPLAAVAGGLWLWLPDDLLGRQLARQQQARAAERQTAVATAAQEHIVQVVAAIRNPQPGQKPAELDPETAKALDHLVEMTKHEMTDPQAARSTAAKLAAARDAMGKLAQTREQELQPLRSELSKLELKEPGPADRFAQALQRGDFAAAQDEWDKLAQTAANASPAAQAALAKQLGQMASQLSGAQQNNPSAQTQPSMAGGTPQPSQTQPSITASGQQPPQTQPSSMAGGQQPSQTQPTNTASASQPPQTQSSSLASSQPPPQTQPGSNSSANGSQQPSQKLAQSLGKMGQCVACSSTQPSTQPAQLTQQAAGQVSQQLQQLAQAQRQAQQLRDGQGQLQQAMRALPGMNNNGGLPQPGTTGQQPGGMQPGGTQQGNAGGQPASANPSGPGGKEGGRGQANQLYGPQRTAQAYQTDQHKDIDDSVGRLIVSWQTDGQMAKGAPTVEFNKAVTEARNEAEKAVAEDRVSKRYQKAIRDYFDGLAPATPPAAPPAETPQPSGP